MSTALEQLRNKLKNKATEKTKVIGNENEISTSSMGLGAEGKIKIRLLPSLNEEDPFFYRTHSYNYLPGIGENGSDIFLHSLKEFKDKNGNRVKNPIDTLVKEIYDSKDEALIKSIASVSKRKRRFYFNCLLLTENGPEFKVFVDATNKGEVTKKICELMDVPFFRDTEDSWVAESTPEEEPYDLLDLKNGYDITISKIKTGNNNWDVDYKVVVSKSPRALTKEEMKLISSRVDLEKYISYETSLEVVKEYVRKLTGDEAIQVTPKSGKKDDFSKISESELEDEFNEIEESQLEEDSDDNLEEVLDLLEDEEEKKPKKKAAKKKVVDKKNKTK